ncbi:TPA: hypothetical protein ACJ51R_000511 [Streptococcus suis]
MEKFQFWLTLGTSVIPAVATGLLSFLASWVKNRADLKSLEKQFTHDLEKMELNHKHQIENIERQHSQELAALKQSHELRLQELEKVSQLDTQTDQGLKINDLIFKAISGEISPDTAISNLSKLNQFANQQNSTNLKKQFVEKLSKK